MKKKDIISIVLAVSVLAIAGLLLYSHTSAGKSDAKGGSAVEVIDPIDSNFNQQALGQLQDPTVTQNLSPSIDLSGLGNSQPFGPLP